MDYVVGSVAALVSGNVTPNRPKLLKRALTPTKHPASPNITPKSEFVDDRSIFLSPTMQKKKAVVKKSPKRIFQNPDLETTENAESNLTLTSPKADKVKKHLEDDLNNDTSLNKSNQETKLPKKKGKNKNLVTPTEVSNLAADINEGTPKKKKKNNNVVSQIADDSNEQSENVVQNVTSAKSPNKIKNRRKSLKDNDKDNENILTEPPQILEASLSPQKSKLNNPVTTQTNPVTVLKVENVTTKKKNKKRNKKTKQINNTESTNNIEEETITENVMINQTTTKKNRKRKKSQADVKETIPNLENDTEPNVENKKSKTIVNPNAVTDKESDSEHESDDEIESENEEINKKVFEAEANSEKSSDEEDEIPKKEISQKETEEKQETKAETSEVNTEDEIKRTLFVGNVPFSPKCKKEIKKIFNKHGKIETIRIRTVPVKDGRYTPKLAVIKNELHPERTTVNVYIRYVDEESVEKALAENNTVLNDHHLRVSRSSQSGKEHDPKCSIFIGNLPFAIEDEVLRQKFENCGEIESVRVIRDKKTNAGKGFGYVNFASKDGVELALAMTEEDLTIKNRIIRVKRCTQVTNKQKQTNNLNKRGFNNQGSNNRGLQERNQGNQRFQRNQDSHKGNQGGFRENQGGFRENQGGFRGNQGGFRGNQGGQRDNQGFRGNQGGFRGNRGGQGGNRGGQGGNRGGQGGNRGGQEGNRGGFRGNRGGFKGNQGGQRESQGGQRRVNNGEDGAHRRIMNKRKSQEGGSNEGPPNKIQKNMDQPNREKKTKKEFVGMTAEKKKKRKFDKGQKKKKTLSEILTK